MTLAYSEPSPIVDQYELQSAQTLQDIHSVSAAILDRYEISHAVLLYMPLPTHSMTLPLLPVAPELKKILSQAVQTNAHPAVTSSRQFGRPRALSDFATSVVDEPVLTQLMTAFRKAGMRQVYELPLVPRQRVRFVLELARIDQPISDFELAQLQSLASIIPSKLPEFLIHPSNNSTFIQTDFQVR
ncbi:MAG: hypothetical protein ACI89J_002593 [Hyphomicrobiaceae bacterium]|jgi:hypothetical protein